MTIDCKLLFKVLESPELYTVFLVKEVLCITAFEMQLKILSPLIAGLCHRSVHTAAGNTERKIGMDVPSLRHKQGWLHQQGGETMVHVLSKQYDMSGETLPKSAGFGSNTHLERSRRVSLNCCAVFQTDLAVDWTNLQAVTFRTEGP